MQNYSTELSVIYSFRNEEQNLHHLIERTCAALESCCSEFEIIFVNDDSNDASLDILTQFAAQDSRIKIINMSRRFGVTECVFAGLKCASGNAAVFLDADLQDPPEIIPQLVSEWRSGSDVVHTVRRKRKGESKARTVLVALAYRIIRFCADLELPVDAGDFKLLSRRAIDHILEMKEARPYIRGLIAWVGFKQSFVEYVREPRFMGRPHFRFYGKAALFQLINGITAFSSFPIYLIILFGFVLLLGAIVLAILSFWMFVEASDKSTLFAVLTLFTLMWASLLLAVGMVGFYISRADENVRNRPMYIIKDRIGFGDSFDGGDG